MTTYIKTPNGIMYLISRIFYLIGGELIAFVCYDDQSGREYTFPENECEIVENS